MFESVHPYLCAENSPKRFNKITSQIIQMSLLKIFRKKRPYRGVSENRGTPKWMVYNGKPLLKWMIWGENPLFSETPIDEWHDIYISWPSPDLAPTKPWLFTSNQPTEKNITHNSPRREKKKKQKKKPWAGTTTIKWFFPNFDD